MQRPSQAARFQVSGLRFPPHSHPLCVLRELRARPCRIFPHRHPQRSGGFAQRSRWTSHYFPNSLHLSAAGPRLRDRRDVRHPKRLARSPQTSPRPENPRRLLRELRARPPGTAILPDHPSSPFSHPPRAARGRYKRPPCQPPPPNFQFSIRNFQSPISPPDRPPTLIPPSFPAVRHSSFVIRHYPFPLPFEKTSCTPSSSRHLHPSQPPAHAPPARNFLSPTPRPTGRERNLIKNEKSTLRPSRTA